MPKHKDTTVAKIILPMRYCSKCALKKSLLRESKSGISVSGSPTNLLPIHKLAKTITGIIGGILILDAAKEMTLFQRNTTAKKIDKKDCNPQSGAIPIKEPSATESAFTSLESSD